MTDGPFKNTPLSARWKNYASACENDAMGTAERSEQAEHAMRQEFWTKNFTDFIKEGREFVHGPQLGLPPKLVIESISEKYPPSPQIDAFMKFLKDNMARTIPVGDAWNQAEDMAVRHHNEITKNRIHEEFLQARERGDLPWAAFPKVVERNEQAFANVNLKKFLEDGTSAIAASRITIAKKTGVYEGPD